MAVGEVHIIGAGVVGLATAAACVERGFKVTIVDREGVAAGASQGNAGAIAWTDVAPLASPGVWKKAASWLLDPLGPLAVRPAYAFQVVPWMVRFLAASSPDRVASSTKAIAALNAQAMPAWERLWRASGTHNQVRRDGCLEVFDRQADLEQARNGWAKQREHGIRVEKLTVSELRDLEPGFSGAVIGGALVPDWVQLDDPKTLCTSIANWLAARDVKFEAASVAQIREESGTVVLTSDDGRTYQSDKAVIACGAWSKHLAAQLGDSVPLDTERGYNITLPEPGVEIRRFIMLPGHGFVLSHLSGGLRIGGAVEFGGLKLPPNWKRVDAMVTKAKRILPELNTGTGQRWMGFRPSMPDSLPVIGLSSAASNVAYAFGHAHHGLTQSAATGELVAQLLSGQSPELDLHPFRATRF
ncbi:D-amino-acid dehydrogenase [Roseibium hamelinense]|uniref:D-amino-acid dehydrogenase n=1 Tax=Roseibium hamelinense TaxID=150831 RepID=A0A562SLU8_9HYPH|nr:FAD-binding oxidoreductase [Roseibium hamelinense]MTI44911.1 FAD-binding oxidoreductase [Roseibium hamelinense]TWI82172.1 D-amino-acid dehydrogenase [Roseibium hamelinense]